MKLSLYSAAISLFVLYAPTVTQQTEDKDTCSFKVSESTTRALITGSDDVVAMTHVIEQPDSPIEILAIDFKDSCVSVANEHFTDKLRYAIKVRNRSDQPIRGFSITVLVTPAGVDFGSSGAGIGSVGLSAGRSLAAGQEMEVVQEGGSGTGGASNNAVLVLVSVDGAALGDCSYIPSRRYPNHLGVTAKPQ